MAKVMEQKKQSIAPVIAIVLMLSVAVFVATSQLRGGQADAPAGYRRVGEADLSNQAHEGTVLAEFTLAQSGDIALFYTLENVDTESLDISIEGADGSHMGVMQAQRLRTDRDGAGEWRQTAPAGAYRLVLRAARGAGTVTVYMD